LAAEEAEAAMADERDELLAREEVWNEQAESSQREAELVSAEAVKVARAADVRLREHRQSLADAESVLASELATERQRRVYLEERVASLSGERGARQDPRDAITEARLAEIELALEDEPQSRAPSRVPRAAPAAPAAPAARRTRRACRACRGRRLGGARAEGRAARGARAHRGAQYNRRGHAARGGAPHRRAARATRECDAPLGGALGADGRRVG
jgi:hypothetical protein